MADELELIETLIDDFGVFKKEVKQKNKTVEDFIQELTEKGYTVGKIFEELNALKAKAGHRAMAQNVDINGEQVITTVKLLKDGITENFKTIEPLHKESGFKQKLFTTKDAGNMTAANNLTGNVVASYAQQPAIRGRQRLHIRDLVRVIPSATGVWKFYRQNKPPGEGSFGFQTTHGAPKNQLDYDTTEVTVNVDYLAGYARIAKQMLQDLPFMQSFLPDELVEDYLRAEDSSFFGALYSAATGSNTSSSTVTAEKIIDYLANLADNDYDANGILLTHQVWAKLLKTKPQDYSLPAGNAITISPNGDLMICGVPVFRTKASYIGTDKMLIGDWSRAAIIQTDGLTVNTYDQDQDNVIRNLVTVKAEARVNLAILRPDAFIYAGAGTT
jgi:HK97 family phage major capsid protein